MTAANALRLIDDLIRRWNWDYKPNLDDFYCNKLLPGIVDGTRMRELDEWEKTTVHQLRELLSASEWMMLPQLVCERRRGIIEKLESDRAREAEEKAAEKRRLEAEELERAKQERARRKAEIGRIRERKEFVSNVKEQFRVSFLAADGFYQRHSKRLLLSQDDYSELKSRFIQSWASQNLHLDLDLEQASAVAAHGGDVKVVARAGSGKTRTLVARAAFLLSHCGADPREMLLLAFNKDAAREMRRRLRKFLKADIPYVMTFHALAYAVVHPEETLVYDDVPSGNEILSRTIQRIVDLHLQSDEYRPLIRDLMFDQFREDWERIVEGRFQLPIDELVSYRRSLPRETLNGEYVKSYGEKLIANSLFEHDISYKYERNYRWNGINYRPDFTILLQGDRGIVIEYFGLEGEADYDEMSKQKRTFWAHKQGWKLIEFSPNDITSRGCNDFTAYLLRKLEKLGVVGRRLSDEEIWEKIRERAIDRFTRAMTSFVARCRKRNLTPEGLQEVIDLHTPITKAESLFLRVGVSVYSAYVRDLAVNKKEDFDGLMWRAVSQIANGDGRFAREQGKQRGNLQSIRFILVDEFQDFSEMFYQLIQEARRLNPELELFCVGDDWQAINGFAGSELRFFKQFDKYFLDTSTHYVTKNYRSPSLVVEVGNALMFGRGHPAITEQKDLGSVRIGYFSEFSPSRIESDKHDGDEATPALLRLVKQMLDSGQNVVLLSRRNQVPWYVNYSSKWKEKLDGLERFVEHVRGFLPEEDRRRVTMSTTHKYKGREKDAVIVVDANKDSYPLVHPNWIFLRIFGDTVKDIVMEERRLLYVALTRAQRSLAILSDSVREASEYVVEIGDRTRLEKINWGRLPSVPSLDGERLEVRLINAYAIREQLKREGYRFNGEGMKYWNKSVPAEGFDIESLRRQPWVLPGVKIEVYTERGELLGK